ncbi:interleukin-12 receptor subunit beta-2-like [Solea senegalensis]|uniref:Interleukin-12 receptor subunit beta-2-like n=1 Tax=Solea senegalensis TaxID=28829 RepID=A0AAV6SAN5_SOLSE|nr:interleukin-12 receptor subunit beta-2 isoform X1 [Solea senegalensis]KAG7513647.1 interleukin-12 receptor subunit beta-2-like [Solea senegalensis]
MFQTWSIFTAVFLLMMQLCTGEKSCVIWSSAGHVVQRNSTFNIYCSFNCKCKRSMYSGQPPTLQRHTQLNLTTIYLTVVNITKRNTFSCQCNCPALDPCGLDISAGYPPDHPKNISCIYKIQNNETGDVLCTWKRGWDTYLTDSTVLWVRTESGNHTSDRESHNKGSDSHSVSLTVPRSVQIIYVWVQVQNPLGSSVSSPIIYSLSDIAMPLTPVLGRVACSSRECIIQVEQRVVTQHLEIQYKAAGETWTSYFYQIVQTSAVQDRSIPSLEPYRLYHFRARSKLSTGQWSQWSTQISTWTQEEAPAEPLDVWYAEPASDLKTPTVYWKEADISIARGRIIDYRVRVYNPDSGSEQVTNVSADARNCSVPLCTDKCDVTVWARNSKGLSPPARVTARHVKARSSHDVKVKVDNSNVTISWRKGESAAPPVSFYVVEWYPEGQRLEELRWMRLDSDSMHAVITGIKPFVCYKGALYVFYNESSVTRTLFGGVATVESAPVSGPLVQETEVEGHTVRVSWMELRRSEQRGCVTKYTIYLKSRGGEQKHYSILAPDRTYKTKDLPPADYSLWMTAWTAEGEGPAGHRLKFHIQQEIPLSLLLVCIFISAILVLLVCLCQIPSVKQKFWVFFQCFMLDVVPDPANSKWAKECTQEKGKIKLQMQLSNSSVSQGEEDPVLVDVEELPKQNSNISTSTKASSQQRPGTLLYPLTTYIKSFSHDSDSSDHTHTSLDTNTTIDYISTHANMEEEEEEEEEEDGTLDFFPSHNIFMEPFSIGGNLTLDTVKVHFCSDLFRNS